MVGQNNFSFRQKVSDKKYFEKRDLNLSIYNNDKLLYNFKRTLKPYRSAPKVSVLDKNKLLLTFIQDGLLEFYNQNQLIKKYLLYRTHPLNEQSIITSKSDNIVVILISELQKNKIYLFDFEGNSVDSMKIENGLISGLSISQDNSQIAYSIFNWEGNNQKNKSIIFDKTLNQKTVINEKFRTGIFNLADNSFLGFTNKNAFCFDLQNSELIWKEKLNNKEIYLDGNYINGNTVLIKASKPNLENGEWIYPNANIFIKNNRGNETSLQQIKTPFQKINFVNEKKESKIKIDNLIIDLKK